ncbi:MAG: C39 family peptidase [Ruminococcus sp.]|nr:C39 family peptidase [Ruminococcus sp.]MDE6784543.1 C39 family peptidase [Ruminococcus sp.]
MKKLFGIITAVFFLAASVSCGNRVQRVADDESIPSETEAVNEEKSTEGAEDESEADKEEVYIEPLIMPKDYKLKKSYVIDGFETVMQEPELPTGCEITALAQTLIFYGFNTTKTKMCDNFLAVDFNGYYTMNDAYLGDPYSYSGSGCNSPVIVNAANDYFDYIGSDWKAFDISGCDIKEVFYEVEVGRPVVVWSTINQTESQPVFQFRLGCGEDFYFNYYQHCLTVYGFDYDEGVVHVADPLVGNVKYEMERFEKIFKDMDSQAVFISGNPETAGKEFTDKEARKAWIKKNRPKDEDKWLRNIR